MFGEKRGEDMRSILLSALLGVSLIFAIAGCGGGESKSSSTPPDPESILSGEISLSGFISYETEKTTSSKSLRAAGDTPNCGTVGKVVLFAANDPDYNTPLTKEIDVDATTCAYNVAETDFNDVYDANTHGLTLLSKLLLKVMDKHMKCPQYQHNLIETQAQAYM